MTSPYVEPSYALLVAGAALVWPPLALIVAGLYLGLLVYIADRRTPPKVVE